MKKAGIGVLIASIVVGVLPLASVVLASLIANLFGCSIDESGTSMCPTVFGDIGGLLSIMGVFGWFTFYSIPLCLCGMIAGGVMLIAAGMRSKKTPVE